jgi:hypothetical protein
VEKPSRPLLSFPPALMSGQRGFGIGGEIQKNIFE